MMSDRVMASCNAFYGECDEADLWVCSAKWKTFGGQTVFIL